VMSIDIGMVKDRRNTMDPASSRSSSQGRVCAHSTTRETARR
jgi:hypothetical protein